MRTLRLLAAALLAATSAFAGDSDVWSDSLGNTWSFGYSYNGNVATIYGVTLGNDAKNRGVLQVPDEIKVGSDKFTVTEIQDGAFEGLSQIKHIDLTQLNSAKIEHLTGETFRNMNGNVTVYIGLTDTLRKELRDGTYGTTRLSVFFQGLAPGLILPYPDCSKAQTVRGVLLDMSTGRTVAGAVEIKLGKAGKAGNGSSRRPVKTTISVTNLAGKKKTFKTTLMIDMFNHAVPPAGTELSLSLDDLPQDKIQPAILSGAFVLPGNFLLLLDGGLGGALKTPYYTDEIVFAADFKGDYPQPEAGWTLLKEALPDGNMSSYVSVKLANGGKKFSIPKATKYKFQKSPGSPPTLVAMDGKTVLASVKDGANKAGMKLTYNAKTGQIKGSFNFYFTNEAKAKVKSSKVKFSGFILRYGPLGYGITTDKKNGPWSFVMGSISP